LLKENSYFSGESSGHLFLNKDYGCFEMPMIMIIKFLQELSASGQTLADYVRPLKKYFPSGEINSTVSDVPAVLARLKETYYDGQQSELDGLSVEYPDWWFNVRASNTEPLIRLNLEARSQEVMENKTAEVLKIIKN
jgi:phosphomannomutase